MLYEVITVGLTLYLSDDAVIRDRVALPAVEGQVAEYVSKDVKSTKTTIPFLKSTNFDYADMLWFLGDSAKKYAWIIFVFAVIFIVTAVSNGANLTDGLDGLAAGTSAIIVATLVIFAYVSGHIEMAHYLQILYIPEVQEMVVFGAAFVGATIGFLWYNSYPAQVFMGDTGSYNFV